jgi:ZIP family zinc transporter
LGLIIGGGGIGFGGLAAYFILYIHRIILPLLIISAVGMIFTLVMFEIIPESIQLGGIFFTFIGITAGYIMAKQIDRLTYRIIIITNAPRKDTFIRSGLVLTFAIALHIFPSGILWVLA